MAAGCGDGAVRDVHLLAGEVVRGLAGLLASVVLLAGCSAPDKFILPGKVDLKLAAGDRMKLCTDDGVDDTTPLSDCVIMDARDNPLAQYAEALKAKGWTRIAGEDDGVREVWALPASGAAAGACSRLVIDAGHEKMTRKKSVIVRFDVSDGACS